jgi:hypothetical protein
VRIANSHRSGSTIISMTKRATRRATTPELTITQDELVYRGPIDLGADSVAITFRAPRSARPIESLAAAFDRRAPHLANEVVRCTPLPLAVIELLARRCKEASPEASAALAAGEGAPDVRWMRAQARRAPSAKGVVETRYHTSNPRDDWPEPGIDLNAVSFYAEDCTWRGTTGVSPERAVIVRNGAIATLVRCKIDGDGGGARVIQSSTLVLCDCVFDRSTIDVEPGSHLLVLNTADN